MDQLAGKGRRAAQRIRRAGGAELRTVYEALLARVEVARSELRLWVVVPELAAFLEWSGLGLFRPLDRGHRLGPKTYLIAVDAALHAPHRDFLLPFAPAAGGRCDRQLVGLLRQTSQAESKLLADPRRDLEQHASAACMTRSKYRRLLRLCYLAPEPCLTAQPVRFGDLGVGCRIVLGHFPACNNALPCSDS